jgi:hypothetical protein
LKTAFSGKLADYKNMKIQLDSFLIESNNQSYLSAKGFLMSLNNPVYQLNSKVYANLSELGKMIPDTLANAMQGIVKADFTSAGKLNIDSIADQAMALLFENSSFAVKTTELTLDMPDSIMNIQNLSAEVKYVNDTLWMNKVSGTYAGLEFGADSTSIAHIYTAAIQNTSKELNIHGNFEVGDMDYAWIEAFMPEEDTLELTQANQSEEEAYQMNFTYKANGKFKAKSFKYGHAVFHNVDVKFLAKENYYVADDVKMDAFDGYAYSSVKVEMLPANKIVLWFKTDVQGMDVSGIMRGFEQYIDQEGFTDKNVKGRLTSQMDGRIVMVDYEPIYDSIMIKGDLILDNGALLNVPAVMEIEKIPGIGIKNLDRLYFSTLQSQLFIYNNKVFIPRTEIRSTSFDAMFLGMYSFGEDYAYHIRMFLGEVLSSKSNSNLRKMKKEGGFVEDDEDDITKGRTSLYLVSKSENGKEKAWFDKKKDRSLMKTKIRVQEGILKFIFFPKLVKYNTEVE